MAKYTTELLSIVQQNSKEGHPIRERIDEAAPLIMPPYPIWDEAYRATLNHKILAHYLSREICAETVGRWKLFLDERMNEIMPYYNQLYLTTIETFDGSNDVNMVISTTTDTQSHLKQEGSGENIDTSKSQSTDYPQGTVQSSDNLFFADAGAEASGSSKSNSASSADSTGNEVGTQTRKGRSGLRTQGRSILDFRDAIINIDFMIIRDLKDLFMTLY